MLITIAFNLAAGVTALWEKESGTRTGLLLVSDWYDREDGKIERAKLSHAGEEQFYIFVTLTFPAPGDVLAILIYTEIKLIVGRIAYLFAAS